MMLLTIGSPCIYFLQSFDNIIIIKCCTIYMLDWTHIKYGNYSYQSISVDIRCFNIYCLLNMKATNNIVLHN